MAPASKHWILSSLFLGREPGPQNQLRLRPGLLVSPHRRLRSGAQKYWKHQVLWLEMKVCFLVPTCPWPRLLGPCRFWGDVISWVEAAQGLQGFGPRSLASASVCSLGRGWKQTAQPHCWSYSTVTSETTPSLSLLGDFERSSFVEGP